MIMIHALEHYGAFMTSGNFIYGETLLSLTSCIIHLKVSFRRAGVAGHGVLLLHELKTRKDPFLPWVSIIHDLATQLPSLFTLTRLPFTAA